VSERVSRDEARRIAALARLRFSDEELTRITAELNHILDHVEALRSVEDRAPGELVEADRPSTRGPAAEQPDTLRREVASFAPDWRDGFFVVPPLPGVHAEDGR
jgi:aspartyl-tRNA(Asn)/glutamyl-tRNA(Gln) amidotransferase subunit C